ncbi:MAG: VCBS repeat-containing protein, partial [Myxococcales bacterium]|nr:VCBS repeat-containing protein [Myxococcales bacterium]
MFVRATLVIVVMALFAGCGPNHSTGDDEETPDARGGDPQADAGDTCSNGALCGNPVMCCAEGNECVEDRCLSACSSGVRCGATLDVCCNAGEVCLADACVVPGHACSDPYDCDPGNFCEPTLQECLPQPDPLTCQMVPQFTDLTVVQEWAKTDLQIISIPVVANLDGVGAPEIVVNTTAEGSSFDVGRIEVLDGATGAVVLGPIAENPPTSYGSQGRSSIAVGDVNGDGKPDIIYAGRQVSGKSLIIAIDYTGAVLWKSHDPGGANHPIKVNNGAVTLVSFDGDASAEVVIGATLIDNDGTVIWDQGGGGAGGFVGTNGTYTGGVAAVADLDGDDLPEIVTGKQAWKVAWNATTPALTQVAPYWTYAGNDGYPAIVDLDKNGHPEVVLVASGKVIALDGKTGALFCAVDPTDEACLADPAKRAQPIAIPGGTTDNIGGPPTIADFDGDARPEIGVAGGHSYSVFDLARPGEDVSGITPAPAPGALFVRWTRTTQDLSSNATGSSVFDFQGDGSAEVIYNDECNVWVYSGVDGRVQLQLPNTTGTIHEYPLVVDADGDGNSEILVVANDGNAGVNCPGQTARRDLYVYGDPMDRWVPTRKVWTQHSYHVTNATAEGNVPLTEPRNWTQTGLNDYRKNAQGEGVFNAPNLAIELAVGLEKCDQNKLVLDARVT